MEKYLMFTYQGIKTVKTGYITQNKTYLHYNSHPILLIFLEEKCNSKFHRQLPKTQNSQGNSYQK